MKRLLTIGHSYVVAANRRLAHEMARAGAGGWEVTCAAPLRYPGDLRPVELEPIPGEACRLVGLPVRAARVPQLMHYGRGLRALLREPWDAVHCWQEPFVLAAAQVALGAPRHAALAFATFQNLPKRYPPPFAQMERAVLRRADGWIAFGHTVEETLAGRPGYRDRPRVVIPPGVDVERFRPDPDARREVHSQLGWAEDGTPVIGFLGRFVEAKGLEVLLEALGRLRAPWRALFVGGGPREAALRGLPAARDGQVRVVTGVPHEGVPAYLAAMDVLAAPSLTTPRWREQFGRMLTEAMACGVAVVGSDSGEIPHVLGGAGLVAPEGDAEALARALGTLLADPALRARVAAAGRARAAAEFALPRVAARHLDFFEHLLASR